MGVLLRISTFCPKLTKTLEENESHYRQSRLMANEGIWPQKNVKLYACYQKRHFRNCQFVTFDTVYGIFCFQLPSIMWIQNLRQFWAKNGFSQKDTHTAFPFLFSSVLLSCYHNLRAKFGVYFAQPSFNVFEWCER